MPTRSFPDYQLESDLSGLVCGADEAGRAPLCGPVTAAAVVLDPDHILPGINDSKKLSARRRSELAAQIIDTAHSYCIIHVSVEEIDRLNILHASMLAMQRAIEGLSPSPTHALIDGNRLPPSLPCAATPIIKGDSKSLSIAAASILAKTARDALMQELAAQYPGYGWERNAGYPTQEHLAALQTLGVTPHHRRSFAPVKKQLSTA